MAGFLASLLGFSADDPAVDPRYWKELYPETWAGNRVGPETSMRISTVYASVNLYAKLIASMPKGVVRVDKNGDETQERDHPLWDLLEHTPNTWQTAFEFWAYLQSSLSLRGNGFARLYSGRRGSVDRMEPIHPDRVHRIERLADGTLVYEISEENGRKYRLLQEEVLHVRAPVTDITGLWGLAPVQLARQTMGLTMAAEEHGARIFSQGARPSGAIEVPGVMSDTAYNRFKAEVQNHIGLANSGKTMILEGGAKFAPLSMTSEELEFIATREFQISEIARWFDIPPVLLHHMNNTTTLGSSVEAIMLAFVKNSLRPWITAWEQAMFRDLISAKAFYRIRFDLTDLLKGDSTALSNYINKLVLGGVMTRNEGRKLIGLRRMDGLDQTLTPSNTVQSDQQSDNGTVNRS